MQKAEETLSTCLLNDALKMAVEISGVCVNINIKIFKFKYRDMWKRNLLSNIPSSNPILAAVLMGLRPQ